MEVGDKVFLKAVGNNARGRKEVLIEEYEIMKIGRKYFEVSNDSRYKSLKFNLEDNRQENRGYIADWDLYFSRQEILDEEEIEKLHWDIKTAFNGYGKSKFTLDQLRRINAIVDENKATKD